MASSLANALGDLPISHHAFHPTQIDGRDHYRPIGYGVRDEDRRGIIIILKPHPEGWISDGRITLRKIEHKVSEIPKVYEARRKPPFTAWTLDLHRAGREKLRKGMIPTTKDYKHDRLGYAYTHSDQHGLEVYLAAYPFNGFIYIRQSRDCMY